MNLELIDLFLRELSDVELDYAIEQAYRIIDKRRGVEDESGR